MTILVDSLETCVNTLRPSVEHRRADCMSRPVSPAEGIDLKFKCDSVFHVSRGNAIRLLAESLHNCALHLTSDQGRSKARSSQASWTAAKAGRISQTATAPSREQNLQGDNGEKTCSYNRA